MKTTKFKASEVGPVPEEWEVKRLGDVASNFNYGVGAEAIPFVSGRKYIRITDIDEQSRKFIPPSLTAPSFETDKSRVNEGDILVARTGASVGKTYIYDIKDGDLTFAGFLMRFHPDEVCPAYVFMSTLMGRYKRWVDSESARSGQPGINIQQLKTFEIPVPPRPEQEKIAEALSDVDGFLAAMTKLIEKKRAIKQGAMQQLLTGKKRLAGFTGKWVEKRFDECFDLVGNNTFAREFMCEDTHGIANIHYGDVLIRYGSVLDCSRTAVPSLLDSVACKTELLKEGDVIIADTAEDETVGKAIEIRGLKDRCAVAGLHTIACRPRFVFAAGWLGYYINSSAFHDQLLPLITGTKVSSISKAGLRTTVLHVPDLIEQQAIAAVLSDMDAEIAALEAKRAKYESIKQGMMQELLTGKTRLV